MTYRYQELFWYVEKTSGTVLFAHTNFVLVLSYKIVWYGWYVRYQAISKFDTTGIKKVFFKKPNLKLAPRQCLTTHGLRQALLLCFYTLRASSIECVFG